MRRWPGSRCASDRPSATGGGSREPEPQSPAGHADGAAAPALTPDQVSEAHGLHAEEGTTALELAARYGVGRETMRRLIKGLIYRDVE